MGKLSGVQNLKCGRLIALLSVFGFMFLRIMIDAEHGVFIVDRDFVMSLCKKIQNRNKMENKLVPWYKLDNMNVRIYRENSYIVVHFFPKETPGIFRTGGDIAYYFVKKEGRDCQYIKALLGQ